MITTIIHPPISPSLVKRMESLGWVFLMEIKQGMPLVIILVPHNNSFVAYQRGNQIAMIESTDVSCIPDQRANQEAKVILFLYSSGFIIPWFFCTTRENIEASSMLLSKLECGLEFRMITTECSPLPIWLSDAPAPSGVIEPSYSASASDGTVSIIVNDKDCRIRAKVNIYTTISDSQPCGLRPARAVEALKNIIDITPIEAYAAAKAIVRI